MNFVTGTVVAFGVFVMFVADEIGFRLFMASLAIAVVASGLVARAWTESIAEGEARVDASAGGLRFSPAPRWTMLFLLLAAVGLGPALVTFSFALVGIPTSMGSGIGRWGPYAIGLLAIGWLAQQVWALRLPVGLTLSEHGLRGIRGSARVEFGWDELARVDVAAERGAKLVLHTIGGARLVIEPRWTGSDPNVVAAIVTHYLEHPGDRTLLADAHEAIGRVEDVRAAQ